MVQLTLSRRDILLLTFASTTASGLLFLGGAVTGYRAGALPGAEAGPVAVVATRTAPPSCPAPEAAAIAASVADNAPPSDDVTASVSTTVDLAESEAVSQSEAVHLVDPVDPQFVVQIGAFSVPENARGLARRMERRGYDPVIVQARNRSGAWLDLVRLSFRGPARLAVVHAEEFTRAEGLPAIVVESDGK
jgi:cell division septation protein DedD